MECIKEIETFIRGGAPGIQRLKECYTNIKKQLCGDDDQTWQQSLSTALNNQGYKEVKSIDLLDPEDFQ